MPKRRRHITHGTEKVPFFMPGKGGKEPPMAEETKAAETQEQTEQTQQAEQPTDWQAKYEAMRQHARDWEKQAKANKGAADELEKLKAEQMSEQEKAVKRAEEAEAELAKLKAAAERAKTVEEVAAKAKLPVDVVRMLNGTSAEELTEQAERIAKAMPAYPTREDEGGTAAAKVRREIPTIF